jgi:hypothetical protein
VADWPLPPFIEPRGPLGEDRDVVQAFVRNELAPYSDRLHVEGPVLMASRDVPMALRIGPRSMLVHAELPPHLQEAKDLVEEVLKEEGLSLFDEKTLYGVAVGVQMVGLRYSSWDLWGADIEQAFTDLRVAASGGEEDVLFGGGPPPVE